MGQIRGKNAKVSACNIRSLSSFGTPYAGMHILVSTDNSATEDGQGNFDAYVVGDGHTAAKALPLIKTYANDVDDEPTAGSEKLIKSGGVEAALFHQTFSQDVAVKASGQTRIALREFGYGTKVAVRIVSNTATLASTTKIQVGMRKTNNSSIYKDISAAWAVFETTEALPFNRIYAYVNGEITQAGTVTLELIFKDAFNANIFDTIPTENSKKAIESGAVYAGLANAKDGINELREDIDGVDNYTTGGWIGQDGLTITSNSDYAYSDYIDVTEGDTITVRKDTSDIDLYASFYPADEGEIYSYILSAGSVSRNFSVPNGYNRLRFSFNKDRDAQVLKDSTVIWEKTHVKGIAEKLDDTVQVAEQSVQVVEQSLTTEQQNQAKANIGLPPGIDDEPTAWSNNLVKSGGVFLETSVLTPHIENDNFSISSGFYILHTLPQSLQAGKSYRIVLNASNFASTDRWADSNTIYLRDANNNRLYLDALLGITGGKVIENKDYSCFIDAEYDYTRILIACRSSYVVAEEKQFVLSVEEITPIKQAVQSKIDKSSILQVTGSSTSAVMSQKAVTDAITQILESKIDYDEREKVPNYYFNNDYLPNKVDFIRNVMESCMVNGDAFFLQSDEHWEKNAQHSPALVKYIADRLNISRLFDCGDTCHNIDAYGLAHVNPSHVDFESLRRKTYHGRLYHVIGNHEYLTWYFTDADKWVGTDFGNWHDFMFYQRQEVDNVVFGDVDKHYYYVDNKAKKIRYIVLSSYKKKEEPIQSGTKYYSVAEYDYSNEQLLWFSNIALNVESGWTILIFTHNFISFNHGERDGEGYIADVNGFVPDKAKPFAQAILTYNGNGTIAAVFTGHWHSDGVMTIDDAKAGLTTTPTGNSFKCIVTTCDAFNFDSLGESEKLYNREADTITEQAFDVVVLDKTIRKITLVRIGAPAYNILEQASNGKYPLFGDLEYREVTY